MPWLPLPRCLALTRSHVKGVCAQLPLRLVVPVVIVVAITPSSALALCAAATASVVSCCLPRSRLRSALRLSGLVLAFSCFSSLGLLLHLGCVPHGRRHDGALRRLLLLVFVLVIVGAAEGSGRPHCGAESPSTS